MNLLPRARSEFTDKSYWESFFKKRGSKSFDWYGEYNELCGLLHKYIKPKDNILVIGCGNSTLSSSLYDVGYRNITNIDTSSVVIRQMQDQNRDTRPGLVFEQRDALNTGYPDGHFSCVLDKGTLDALMPDENESTVETINRLFQEVDRVLRIGGRYVCVSLLQPHIVQHILRRFPAPAPTGHGWPVRVCRCVDTNTEVQTTASTGPAMPVFLVVCTKFKAAGNLPSLVELSVVPEHVTRTDVAGVLREVKELQEAALVTWQLRSRRQQPGSTGERGPLSLQLHRPGEESSPRYTLQVADRHTSAKNTAHKFAAFVVPQGRETEYLFASPEGHKQLLSMVGAERLVIISLHRGQSYEGGLSAVQDELAPCIVQLAPQGLPSNTQIPFMSSDDDTGHREVIYEGHSDFSGDFVVEDVEVDGGERFRKLVFLGSRGVVQSEAKLSRPPRRKGKGSKGGKAPRVSSETAAVDLGYLACEHHRLMAAGGALQPQPHILVIGLGGGGLCSFLHRCFPASEVTAVEIDPCMKEVACKYFGLSEDSRLHVCIGDGLQFIAEAARTGQTYDAVLFDVDNKDTSLGMSCPPVEFVTQEVLNNVKSILKNNGVFVLNLVCRDPALHSRTLTALESVFPTTLLVPLEGEVNEILFCGAQSEVQQQRDWLRDAAAKANAMTKKMGVKDELIDVTELMKNVKISPK